MVLMRTMFVYRMTRLNRQAGSGRLTGCPV